MLLQVLPNETSKKHSLRLVAVNDRHACFVAVKRETKEALSALPITKQIPKRL
jgi:hypothetical protein